MTQINKWQLHRAGVLNYWYYDEAEFHFAGGRLLLRGSNGSGKSVTMQSLITVLLDGVKSPDRLDSFGSRSRRMEDYLLGEKEVSGREERTGYLFLEYKREQTEQYITTGIGLHAKRGGALDFWGFVLTKNRRLNRDLFLYKEEIDPATGKKQRVPLSRRELERALAADGQVVRGQKEYMELVNRYIFGFESVDKYQELMKLLIQLRSPKLSKDFRPSVIYEILNESLPSLSDDELRPLSDTIESMERTKLQIEQLDRERQALQRLCRQYDQYNRGVLAEKSLQAQQCAARVGELQKEIRRREKSRAADETTLGETQTTQDALEREQKVLVGEKEAMERDGHDVFQAERQKLEQERLLAERTKEFEGKQGTLSEKKRRELRFTQELQRQEEIRDAYRAEMDEQLAEMDERADDAAYQEHALLAAAFRKGAAEEAKAHFAVWKKSVEAYAARLQSVRQRLSEAAQLTERKEAVEIALGKERRRQDQYRDELEKLRRALEEERDALLRSFYEWKARHGAALPLEEAEELQIIETFQNLYEGAQWATAETALDAGYQRRQEALGRDIGLAAAEQKKLADAQGQLGEELRELKEKRDPEPERSPDHSAARALLAARQTPFLPLYAAVEFRPEVDAATRERIEAALTEMGLLDALILPAHCKRDRLPREMYGAILTPNPQFMTATLLDYLYPAPDGAITAEEIADVLSSIAIDESFYSAEGPADAALTVGLKDGVYRMGFVHGRAARREGAVYIGRQARQAYRKAQIARLEGELDALAARQETLRAEREALQAQRAAAQAAKRDFPVEDAIRTLLHQKDAVDNQLKLQDQRVRDQDAELRALVERLQALQSELRSGSAGIALKLSMEAYNAAIDEFGAYRGQLQELEIRSANCENAAQNARLAEQEKNYAASEVDELKGDILTIEGVIAELRLKIEQIAARLEQMGANQLRERIAAVAKRLNALPDEIDATKERCIALRYQLQTAAREVAELAEDETAAARIADAWRRMTEHETRLGLVFEDGQANASALAELQREWRERHSDIHSLAEKLSEKFYGEQGSLQEYHMRMEDDSAALEMASEQADDRAADAWRRVREANRRKLIVLTYEGRAQTPYQQTKLLEQRIREQTEILSERDKALYEEVIMNSIGRTISQRIHAAEQWIEQMNRLMQQRDTSSGLRFKLEWKALTADRDDELDTSDLVFLLHSDPALLRDADLKKMVIHFQSRIQRAKDASENGIRGAETFQTAIREQLDYRKWFQFKLYYDQGDKIKHRELTDKVFYKFSGGEKAMAMYIPLFSAAYSRYQEARPDAPYVITLDEAFAGVDENNIREMFDLVEQLGFNYIMNSQALWGDYDVVPSLNIYELLRPANAPYVGIVHCHWNGKVRSYIGATESADAP